MARKPAIHPTDGELEILSVLWQSGPQGLGELWQALNAQRPVAKTTVATMLNVMLDKKLVRRQRSPQGYRWSAEVTRDAAAQGLLGKVIDQLFEGSARRLVLHLADQGNLSADDMQAIGRLLAQQPDEPPDDASSPPGAAQRKEATRPGGPKNPPNPRGNR